MGRQFLIAVLALFGVSSSTFPASALPASGADKTTSQFRSGGALEEGAFAAPPKAFLGYCDRYVSQCVRVGTEEIVTLDERRWSQLLYVNLAVNRRIRPTSDAFDIDNWILGASHGACNAYAIEKRKELLDLGWPSAALALTVVYTGWGQAHLVLTARTDRGDYVLDNLRGAVLLVDFVDYRWVMRQSTVHPRLWVSVEGVSSNVVAQVETTAPNANPHDEAQPSQLAATFLDRGDAVSAEPYGRAR